LVVCNKEAESPARDARVEGEPLVAAALAGEACAAALSLLFLVLLLIAVFVLPGNNLLLVGVVVVLDVFKGRRGASWGWEWVVGVRASAFV
jgi:hypothetical protein